MGNNNIFMTIFVVLGAVLMAIFYFLRAFIFMLPVIIVVALIGMIIYSIRKNKNNDD